MTIIEGDTGLIIVDPLFIPETARAALDLYFQHRPRKPISAAIYTHSHVDHFGGVKGVISEEDVRAGKVKIIAPDKFMDHAVAENVLAGNAMSRRVQYQFGTALSRNETGYIDGGLGKALPRGLITLIPPTDLITQPVETRTIDGVEIVFVLTPGTEAPSEMVMHYPQFRVLNMAEVATQNFHNLYTIRGAEVRDANAWAKYINQALELFGDKSDVVIAQHHWPTWGAR
jgi:alkyl sulfatase BDS1-like metallo-beta-lactamase superfamily hydrolase